MVRQPVDRREFQSLKLRRIFQRDLPPEQREAGEINKAPGFRHIILELPWSEAEDARKKQQRLIDHLDGVLKVVPFNPETDTKIFSMVFNTILMTSPDPYRPITEDEAQIFSEGTFLAYLYGEPAGFAALTVEDTPEGKIGVIAGIGVMPRYRGKKVAIGIALAAMDFFKEKHVTKLQCEVFEGNDVSQKFIRSLGFQEVGQMFLATSAADQSGVLVRPSPKKKRSSKTRRTTSEPEDGLM